MKNKKAIMSLAALMILLFHLWIPIFNYKSPFFMSEMFLKQICYIGVDIFFFVSASSIATREIKYKEFIKNRFINIYLKFVIFAIIATIYKGWNITRFLEIVSGIELINKGGGSFLWFLPAIMVFYLIAPLFKKLDDKHPIITPISTFFLWITITLLTSIFAHYTNLFIVTNRIPIFLLGYYVSKYKLIDKLKEKKLIYWIITISLIVLGNFIAYKVFINKVNPTFLKEAYYIFNIPLIIGIVLLIDKLPQNFITNKLGTITLEVYAIQMIFGYNILNGIFNKINTGIVSVLITFIIIFLLSFIFNYLYSFITKRRHS